MTAPPIFIAGGPLTELASMALSLGAPWRARTVVHTSKPASYLSQYPREGDRAGIVFLDRADNTGDLQAMFRANAGVLFVLVSPDHPPHAAVAKVARKHASAILSRDESTVVIATTLVALISRHDALAV